MKCKIIIALFALFPLLPLLVSNLAWSQELAQEIQEGQENKAENKAIEYGEWSIICDRPEGAEGEQCSLFQNVVADDRQEMGLSVVILKTADKSAQILRVLAPLGVLLPNGLGLTIDDEDMGRIQFSRCIPEGCSAETLLDEVILDKLKSGRQAIFAVFATPEEGIGVPVSLEGFSQGYNALP